MEVPGQLLLRPRACCFPRVQRASRNSCRARPTGTVLLIRSDRSAAPFGGLSARTETRTAPQLNSSGRTGSGAKAMPSSCSSSIRRQSTVRNLCPLMRFASVTSRRNSFIGLLAFRRASHPPAKTAVTCDRRRSRMAERHGCLSLGRHHAIEQLQPRRRQAMRSRAVSQQ